MWTPDPSFMQAAIEEALKGAGRTHPNPSVGAALVSGGRIVGLGFHEGPGHPHAEVAALRQAGERSHGADLYVTLEPCCTTGRTGPCTAAVIAAGVARVAAATLDPNPKVDGAGVRELQAAGIPVAVGCLAKEGMGVDPAYHTFYRKGRPHVHLKWAQTLDGRVVLPGGGYITGPEARLKVHMERYLADALLVSGTTVAADDPKLTIRLPGVSKALTRVVLDNKGLLTGREGLFATTPEQGPVWIFRPPGSPRGDLASLPGVSVIEMPLNSDGRLPLAEVLHSLHGRGIMGVYAEAVGRLASAFLREGLVDRVSVYLAPLLAGTTPGPAALEGHVRPGGGARVLGQPRWERAGADWVVAADLEDSCSPD